MGGCEHLSASASLEYFPRYGPLLNGPYVATLRARESIVTTRPVPRQIERKKRQGGAVTRTAREEGPAKYIR